MADHETPHDAALAALGIDREEHEKRVAALVAGNELRGPKCGLWGCGRKATTTATVACAGMESRDIVICPYHAQMFLSAREALAGDAE